MEDNIYTLIYSSRSAEKFSNISLVDLCAKAARKNEKLGVTGVLICVGNQFLQVLEGNSNVVKNLYAEIKQDPRHTQCRVLYDAPIVSRSFNGWGMNFMNMNDSYFLQFEEFKELKEYVEKKMSADVSLSDKIREIILKIPKLLSSYKIGVDVVSPFTIEKGKS